VEFEKQKPVSDEYQENWERLFGLAPDAKEWREIRAKFYDQQVIQTFPAYPNGCPILKDEE